MVRQLIGLKSKILWNTMTRQTWVLVMSILGLLYAAAIFIGMTLTVVISVLSGAGDVTLPIVTLGESILVLGWWLVPTLFSGMDNTLDPRKFAPYIGPSPRFAVALTVATGVGVAGLISLLLALIPPVAWALSGQWGAAVIAAVMIPVSLLTAFVWARVLSTWVGLRLQATSKRRDMSQALATIVFLAVVSPMGLWISWFVRNFDFEQLMHYTQVVAWTPFGAAWGVPLAIGQGQFLIALGRLLIAMLTLVGGMWLWTRILSGAMSGLAQPVSAAARESMQRGEYLVDPSIETAHVTHTHHATHPQQGPIGLAHVEVWQMLGLSSPTASLAARTSRYWIRDNRLLSAIFMIPLFFFMAIMWPKITPDNVNLGWFFIFIASISVGSTIGILAQYDSTALWILVSSSIRGRQERRARIVGSLPLLGGLIVVGVSAFAYFTPLSFTEYIAFLVLVLTLSLVAAVVTSVIGARWVYPIQPPGTSVLSTRGTGSIMTTTIIQTVTMLASALVSLPVIVMHVLVNMSMIPVWIFVLVGILWTGLVTHYGVLLAGKVWDRYSPDVLSTIRSWPGH